MDLANPVAEVMPSAHGTVLAVLARTTEPLNGRQVADLSDGRVKERRASQVLGELTVAGVVLCEHRPPVKLYLLNRDHIAAPGLIALADMWGLLLDRLRDTLGSWELAPASACMFGSAARGEAGRNSDIDLLVVRCDTADPGTDATWNQQIDDLAERVRRWTGNPCEVLDLTLTELGEALSGNARLVRDLKNDAINLAGRDIRSLLRKVRVK